MIKISLSLLRKTKKFKRKFNTKVNINPRLIESVEGFVLKIILVE